LADGDGIRLELKQLASGASEWRSESLRDEKRRFVGDQSQKSEVILGIVYENNGQYKMLWPKFFEQGKNA